MPDSVDRTSDEPPESESTIGRPGERGPREPIRARPHQTTEPPPPAHAPRPSGESRFVPGTVIAGRYRIVSMLGRGGMGEVFRAEDLRLAQTVAIKFLPREFDRDARRLERLTSEVRLARQVSHANVARIYDIGDAEGEHFLTMEFVDGEDLASLLRRIGRPNPEKAVEIARQLCAGLAAMHDRGLLHRDLKPANVMVDGRGVVRIMDFGLALRTTDSNDDGGGVVGTPAYMAPEQWAHDELTTATDVYAVGLILYELFTGRPAVAARSSDDFRRWHTSGSTDALSSSLSSVDPLYERIILRCLEKEPSKRPPSALAVAAMLPGGDPIAAALAAGETPSPEMVAAASRAGRLAPARAIPLAMAFVAAIITWLLLPSPARPWEFAALRRSPEVLRDRATQLLDRIGYSADGQNMVGGFTVDREALEWLTEGEAKDGAERFERIRSGEIGAVRFYLRTSPRPLVALNSLTRVSPDDPAFDRSGMTLLMFEPDGRLLSFEAIPTRIVSERATDATVEQAPWAALFEAAGLELAKFDSVAPTRRPRSFADTVVAWVERQPADGALPMRVEAASLEGRVVQFVVIAGWIEQRRIGAPAATPEEEAAAPAADAAQSDGGPPAGEREPPGDAVPVSAETRTGSAPPAGAAAPQARLLEQVIGWSLIAFFAALLVLFAVLAVRHARAGRGDLRGARILAIACGCIAFVRWFCTSDPSLSPGYVNAALAVGAALALFVAALAWLFYMALEPITRRVWPSTLVTWQRLLQGRVTDPQVGRDLLVGSLAGVAILIASSVALLIELRMGVWPRIDFGSSWSQPWLFGLMGGRHVLGLVLMAIESGLVGPMGMLLFVVLSKIVLRRTWLAVLPLGVLFTAAHIGGAMPVVATAAGAVTIVIVIVLVVRYGLVALMGAQVTMMVLSLLPATIDASAWYFTDGLLGLLTISAIAGFGLWAALAGRPAPAWDPVAPRRAGGRESGA